MIINHFYKLPDGTYMFIQYTPSFSQNQATGAIIPNGCLLTPKNRCEIWRNTMNRTVLVSMVTIGLIAGTVGISTTAYFNDSETSANNTFDTGAIDLKLGWDELYNGEKDDHQELTDNPGPIFDLDDIKPGDHGKASVDLNMVENPGWVWMRTRVTADKEIEETEPETSMGDTDPDGELNDELILTIWKDDGDGELESDEEVLKQGSLRSIQSDLRDGELLGSFGEEEAHLGIKWKLPEDVGNRVQKDRVKMDFDFYAEQRRHNANPENPWTGEEKNPENEDPEASFKRANKKALETKVGKEIRLYSTSSDDKGIDKLKWELRDNTTKFGQDIRHSWSSPGNYTVKLTVTDTDGNTDSTTRVITVCENDTEQEPGDDPTEPDEPDDSNETADYTLKQDDTSIELRPIEGDQTPESLYDFRIPDQYTGDNGATDPGSGPYYQSVGTDDLQAQETSIMFLYEGPEGLNLVIVHDQAGGDGGSATWTMRNLSSGEWSVKDDLYLNPDTGEPASTNYDRWNVSGNPQVIDWTWGGGGTDGGVYSFEDDDLNFTIEPEFNQESALWDQYYTGTIDDWQVLSGDRSNPNRTSLNMSEPVTIESH